MPKPVSHIAVIRLSAMGDVAMTVPVLRALVKQHPDVKITMISRGFFKPFFADIPNVEFFEVDLKGKHKGVLGLYRLYSELKKRNIDAFADLHNVLRSKIVRAFFSLGRTKVAHIDKGRSEKNALTRAENKVFKPLKSNFERYADVFRQLGFSLDLANPEFPATQNLSDEVRSISGEKALKWIGIAPFAAHSGKQYPMDLMREIVGQLSQYPENKLFLFGAGTNEIKQLESLSDKKNNVVVVAGKLKLSQELNLIQNLDVMLSMDSGNAHLSALFGVKTVTLWGATHPFAGFSPFNQTETNALLSDRNQFPLLPTSVYGNKIVPGYENAMRTILPEAVVNKIQSLL